MYALTRCSMYFSDASRPIGNSTAVIDDHEEADAVDADDVADAERGDPALVLDELEVRAVVGLKFQSRQTREAERDRRWWRSRPPSTISGRRAGMSSADQRADERRDSDDRERIGKSTRYRPAQITT